MAGAIANVALSVGISGVETVSVAAERAKRALGGVAGESRRAAAAAAALAASPTIDAARIQSTTQRAGGAIAALTAAMGPAGASLAEAGRSATALGSAANVIPGPIGIAAAAIVGLAAGAYLLAKNVSESAAKLRLLGGADTVDLKAKFDLATDGAIQLSQAIDALGKGAVRPTDDLIRQVIANATAMGQEPVEAVAKFMAAWKEGPEAINKVQQEIGNLGVRLQSTVEVARSLNLDPKALGLSATATTAERLRKALEDASKLRKTVADTEVAIVGLLDRSRMGHAAERADAMVELAAKRKTLEQAKSDLALEEGTAKFRARRIDDERRLGETTQAVADIREQADLDAQSAVSKQTALAYRLKGADDAREVVAKAIVATQELVTKGAGAEATERLKSLQRLDQQLEIQSESAKAAAKAEKKAKADAGAQDARAARQAAMDATLRILKARADRDGLQTEKERSAILDAEHRKALDATAGIKGAKARATDRLAVDEEYATKKAALERQMADETTKTNDDLRSTLEGQAKRSADLARAADEAIAGSAKARSASLADALRGQGRDEEAALVESRQAQADYSQAIIGIDRERAEAMTSARATTTDAANIEIAADAKRVQAKLALDAVEAKLADTAHERAVRARSDAVSSLEGPANALRALGAKNATAGAAGESLLVAIKGFKDLDAAMSASEAHAQRAAAVGAGVATGIADAVIDAQTRNTLQQIDNDEKRALSTANTEEERARITEEFESRKAKAVEDAARRKAAILAAMEAIQAIVSVVEKDYVAAAGHTAAAIGFAAIAGGAGGATPAASSSAGTTSSGSGSAFTGGSSTAVRGGGTGNVYHINVYPRSVIGTPQQVGKEVHSALKSLKGTGFG